MLRVFGQEFTVGSAYYYYKPGTRGHYPSDAEKSDGWVVFNYGALLSVLAPPAIYLAISFYTLSVIAVVVYGTAHVARLGRRGQKLLGKHISDPDAHKNG